jgi:hypothetical protein
MGNRIYDRQYMIIVREMVTFTGNNKGHVKRKLRGD